MLYVVIEVAEITLNLILRTKYTVVVFIIKTISVIFSNKEKKAQIWLN